MTLNRRLRYNYLKILRLKGTPKSLALGTAIGVYIGMTPTIPFHTILILLVTVATRSSPLAGILASWIVCNPLTYIPIYYMSIRIGNKLTPYELNWSRIQEFLTIFTSSQHSFSVSFKAMLGLGYEAIIVLLVGGLVLGLPFFILSYSCCYRLFCGFQEKRRTKRLLRKTTHKKKESEHEA